MNEPALQRVSGVIFGDEREPVIAEPGGRRAAHLEEPHRRIIPQRNTPGRARQQILAAVGVGLAQHRIEREIALGIMPGRSPADRGQLVEAVGDARRAARAMAGPGKQIVEISALWRLSP